MYCVKRSVQPNNKRKPSNKNPKSVTLHVHLSDAVSLVYAWYNDRTIPWVSLSIELSDKRVKIDGCCREALKATSYFGGLVTKGDL